MDEKFNLKNIPNWVYITGLVILFVIYMIFFDKNIGYSAVVEYNNRIDTLEMQCNELRSQITVDSTALESVYDSAKFEHYLRTKRLFVGEGETMYRVND